MENMRPFESLHINEARLMARIEQFAALAPTRVAFSDEDLSGRKLMVDLMQDAGLAVRIDPAGNLIGRMAGRNEGPAMACSDLSQDSSASQLYASVSILRIIPSNWSSSRAKKGKNSPPYTEAAQWSER
jgi:hypothetical protein